jgi:non-ribosomal peptide synthetase component F
MDASMKSAEMENQSSDPTTDANGLLQATPSIDGDVGVKVNVARHLKTMARIQPYRRAVVFPAAKDANGRVAYSHLTFRQLDRESDCLAHGLQSAGIGRGVRTIVMVRPSLEFFALTFAMFKVGAVPVMVDPGMGVRRMLSCLQESRAQAMIGIPPAHVLRVFCPGYFKNVKTAVTVGRRWFWKGLTIKSIRSPTLKFLKLEVWFITTCHQHTLLDTRIYLC